MRLLGVAGRPTVLTAPAWRSERPFEGEGRGSEAHRVGLDGDRTISVTAKGRLSACLPTAARTSFSNGAPSAAATQLLSTTTRG